MTAIATVSGKFENRLQAEAVALEIIRGGLADGPVRVETDNTQLHQVGVTALAHRYREVEQLLRDRGAMGWETTIPDEGVTKTMPVMLELSVPEADRLDQSTNAYGQYEVEVNAVGRHGYVSEVEESELALQIERSARADD